MTDQQRHILRWIRLLHSILSHMSEILAHNSPNNKAWDDIADQLESIAKNIRERT